MALSYRVRLGITFIVGLLYCVVVVPVAIDNGHKMAASYLVLLGGLFGLWWFLDIRKDRALKGLMIIAYGVCFQVILIPMYFFPDGQLAQLPPLLKRNLDVFGQLIALACAGAGGSILAAHSDRTSKDNDQHCIDRTVIDNTLNIGDLITATKHTNTNIQQLNKLVRFLIGIVVLMAVLLLVLAVTVFAGA